MCWSCLGVDGSVGCVLDRWKSVSEGKHDKQRYRTKLARSSSSEPKEGSVTEVIIVGVRRSNLHLCQVSLLHAEDKNVTDPVSTPVPFQGL